MSSTTHPSGERRRSSRATPPVIRSSECGSAFLTDSSVAAQRAPTGDARRMTSGVRNPGTHCFDALPSLATLFAVEVDPYRARLDLTCASLPTADRCPLPMPIAFCDHLDEKIGVDLDACRLAPTSPDDHSDRVRSSSPHPRRLSMSSPTSPLRLVLTHRMETRPGGDATRVRGDDVHLVRRTRPTPGHVIPFAERGSASSFADTRARPCPSWSNATFGSSL